ncbi:MAG: MaoC family dehydratase [Alphaproteobacteria bacterium]|nr:MaoC family dehydratase [Alphaproteobacteria bacterium]
MSEATGAAPIYFEDFAVGETRRYGGRSLTAADIIRFAREFDPQTYHTDPEAAKGSIFGGLVASGLHTQALVLRMIFDQYLKGGTALASPGIDEVRWIRPVRPGDTLTVATTVTATVSSRSRPDRGLVKMKHVVANQTGATVMTMLGMAFFKRRPKNASA